MMMRATSELRHRYKRSQARKRSRCPRAGACCNPGAPFDSLETRHLLASIRLVEQTPLISADHVGPTSVIASDLDDDGDLDLISASALDSRVGWYPNLDGQGEFGRLTLISDEADGVAMVRAADLDGDGDQDIVAALYSANEVVWYENLDARGRFGDARVITEFAIAVSAIDVADVDGDGLLDVVSSSSGNYDSDVSWYRNVGDGDFGGQQIISSAPRVPLSVVAADVDGDGDTDVLSASYVDDTVAWYENTDGAGTFGPQRIISDQLLRASEVIAADVDGDGDLDAIAGTGYSDGLGAVGEIAWFENTDGAGTFGPPQTISRAVDFVESLEAQDLDGDGDLDLISASFYDGQLIWFETRDANSVFAVRHEVDHSFAGPTAAHAADLDGDGDLDLAVTFFRDDVVAWVANVDGRGMFDSPKSISATGATGVETVRAADLDGDGDLDALSASQFDNTFAWYENLDGRGSFGSQQIIDANARGATSVQAADLDGDGDLDILGSSATDATVAWYENIDGKSFSQRRVISDSLTGTEISTAADLDGDGDFDVVAAATYRADSSVVWFENQGGGNFGAASRLGSDFDVPRDIRVADLDEDGDADIVVASSLNNTLFLLENSGGGMFEPAMVISIAVSLPLAIDIADVDGDSHLDIVATSFLFGPIPDEQTSKISYFPNPQGNADFGPERTIAIGPAGVESVDVGDLDGDGDLDIVAGFIVDRQIAWYENLDGEGNFGTPQIVDTVEPGGIEIADLDGDGDGDLLAGLYLMSRVTWYQNQPDAVRGDFSDDGQLNAADVDLLCRQIQAKDHQSRFDLTGDGQVDLQDLDDMIINNLRSTFGDANLDGTFDSSDLVAIFRNGQFEDDIEANSGWGDGDWNCDGEFDTGDLVVAFQAGGYQADAQTGFNTESAKTAAAIEFVRQDDPNRFRFGVDRR